MVKGVVIKAYSGITKMNSGNGTPIEQNFI